MSVFVWGAFGEEWAAGEKVSFNGLTKEIVVNDGVTTLDIRADVYSAWKRWVQREHNSRFLAAMRASGGDPVPGGFTGSTFFVQNGWRLVVDLRYVAVTGVLYSVDYDTAYWDVDGDPLYPAAVSALVNAVATIQNVITATKEEISTQVWADAPPVASDAPTATQNANAVWSALIESGMSAAELMRLMASFIAADAENLDTGNPTFKSLDGTKTRLSGTYSQGVRTIITRDGT